MIGNEPKSIVIQARDLLLLNEIAKLGVVDREQARKLAGFGSVTRINARLLQLTRYGLLKRFYVGFGVGVRKAVYFLSPQGAHRVGAPYRRLRRDPDEMSAIDLFFAHQSMVNDFYVALTRPIQPQISIKQWRLFQQDLGKGLKLRPDAFFELHAATQIKASFLEADLGTEREAVWNKKVLHYLKLATSGLFQQTFGHDQFRVLVVTSDQRRVEQLANLIRPFTTKIFWLASLPVINREGPWSFIWSRPGSDKKEALA